MKFPFARARATLPLTFLPGLGPRSARDLDTPEEQLNANSGWVKACTDLIAADIAANPWRLEDDDGPVAATHPAARLLRQPNAQQRWSDLIQTTDLHLSLCGQACWRLHLSGPRLTAITVIYPHWLLGPVLDAAGNIGAYRVCAPGGREESIPAEQLAFTRLPHPTSPHRGSSPTQGVAASHDLDQAAREFTASLLHNRARPDGILATEQELTREQADIIRERWRDTHERIGEIAVLGKGVQYLPLSGGLKDLDFTALARVTRDAILAAFKVPATKLGILENASLANGREADQNYKESALRPRLNRYAELINTRVLGHYHHPGLRFAFENPIDEDRAFELERATKALSSGAITVNEYRQLIGMAPLRGGNHRLLPGGVTRAEP